MIRKQRQLWRELALLWLYQIDVAKVPMDEAMATIPEELEGLDEEGKVFAEQLTRGVLERRRELDRTLNEYARGWTVPRMAAIERNVLRIALYEINYVEDIPTSVSADEAVRIAKRYATDESGKFVNGILGAYIRGEEKKAKEAEPEKTE